MKWLRKLCLKDNNDVQLWSKLFHKEITCGKYVYIYTFVRAGGLSITETEIQSFSRDVFDAGWEERLEIREGAM